MYRYPRLSPDGGHVALQFEGIGGEVQDIWLYDLERDSPRRLTVEGANVFPVWTPDGTRLTFSSSRSGGRFNLFWKPADGSGEAEELLRKPTILVPGSWSADGNTLVYYDGDGIGDRDLWVLSREGEPSVFLATAFDERSPRLSPNGAWVAYVSDESGEDRVYVQPFPDGGRVIPISTGAGTEPVWSRDGTELFFRDRQQMLVVAVEPGTTFSARRPELLFERPYDTDLTAQGNPNYDVAPDRRFLMVRPAMRLQPSLRSTSSSTG